MPHCSLTAAPRTGANAPFSQSALETQSGGDARSPRTRDVGWALVLTVPASQIPTSPSRWGVPDGNAVLMTPSVAVARGLEIDRFPKPGLGPRKRGRTGQAQGQSRRRGPRRPTSGLTPPPPRWGTSPNLRQQLCFLPRPALGVVQPSLHAEGQPATAQPLRRAGVAGPPRAQPGRRRSRCLCTGCPHVLFRRWRVLLAS